MRAPALTLDPEFVRSILTYDPDTGILRWKWRKGIDDCGRQLAGMVAGSRSKKDGRLRISINDKGYAGYRLAWAIMTGEWPAGDMDHKDGNPSNDKWDNLRVVTKQQNQQNRRIHKSNKSGFKGVFKNHNGITWSAQIYDHGRKIHVGCFKTAEEAHSAYCAAAKKHYGEFSRTQ